MYGAFSVLISHPGGCLASVFETSCHSKPSHVYIKSICAFVEVIKGKNQSGSLEMTFSGYILKLVWRF